MAAMYVTRRFRQTIVPGTRDQSAIGIAGLLTLNETVDLINDAGFSAGDIVFAAIDVVAGNDATAPTMFTVTQNGKTASFDATGTTLNTGLTYNGTK
ncbi:MAG: hypothetical protein M1820_005829 [Bogoriella megaspora]|nr:MAG: hypothetical protein M1820_005829 [Bogoriella megaspora]